MYKDNVVRPKNSFQLVYGDLTDSSNILRILQSTKPDEIYNLGAQSHVHTSFTIPEYTANVDAFGALRILEAIKILKLEKKQNIIKHQLLKFLEIQVFLKMKETFKPRSPYAVAKLYAYWITVKNREAYNIFAVNGILFNHEGSREVKLL